MRSLVVTAMVLSGLSMRTAVTSVGAVLDDLQRGLHTSGAVAGVITTLPVVCFAGLGALTPRVARHVGVHRLLVVALALTTAGLALRAAAPDVALFALFSVLALAGAAASNVLMPSLVKLHFPDRIGPMTAVYTTALATGATAAAGLTVPIGDLTDGWRGGLASWAVLTALAVLPWLPTVRHDRAAAPDLPPEHGPLPLAALARTRTAWVMAAFFGAQSMQAYIAFGWFARFLRDHGIGAGEAGAMVAALSAVGIPISLLVPRLHRQFEIVLVLSACNVVAYTGLALAPVSGAWVWMILAGFGGGTFPLILTVLGQRARTPAAIASLSAFVQGIGYLVGGAGPLLFGALFSATGSWALPLAVLFVATGVVVLTGWSSTRRRFVEDELPASAMLAR